MRIATELPSPNQRMNTGTHASDGIGISALASGRQKFSTVRKRPIRIPSGNATAIAIASPKSTRYIVKPACSSIVPSRRSAQSVLAIFGKVGSSAAGKTPLRATAS